MSVVDEPGSGARLRMGVQGLFKEPSDHKALVKYQISGQTIGMTKKHTLLDNLAHRLYHHAVSFHRKL